MLHILRVAPNRDPDRDPIETQLSEIRPLVDPASMKGRISES